MHFQSEFKLTDVRGNVREKCQKVILCCERNGVIIFFFCEYFLTILQVMPTFSSELEMAYFRKLNAADILCFAVCPSLDLLIISKAILRL